MPSVAFVHAVLRSALTAEPVRTVWDRSARPSRYADATIDPDVVTAYSRRQGVVASVYRQICHMESPMEPVADALRPVARCESGTALFQAQALQKILRAFEHEGIPVMVLNCTSM